MKSLALLATLIMLNSCDREFFKVVSASYAKELCSCLYVEKQSPKTCEDYATQIIKVEDFHINEEKKMVVAQGMGFSTTSFYRGQHLGCSLP